MTDLNLITPNSNLTLNLDEQAALDFSNNLQQAQLPIVPPVGLPRIPGLNPDGSFGSNPLELLEGPADVLLNILRTTGTVLGNSASPILATRSGIALPREVLDLLPQPVRAIFANNQGVAGALILPPDTEARLLREGAGALPGIFRETTIWLAANPVGGTLGGTPVIGGGAAVVTINFKNGFDRPEVSFGQGFGYNFNVGGRFGLTPTGPNSDIWTFLNRRVSANEIAELFGSGIGTPDGVTTTPPSGQTNTNWVPGTYYDQNGNLVRVDLGQNAPTILVNWLIVHSIHQSLQAAFLFEFQLLKGGLINGLIA